MSKSVVTAAAAAHARHLGQKKLIKKSEDQNPAQDDQQAVDGKEEAAKAVQTENGISQQTSMSDAPLGAFSFEGALAEASAGLAADLPMKRAVRTGLVPASEAQSWLRASALGWQRPALPSAEVAQNVPAKPVLSGQ